jgi:RTX calcium-binding nonapeptide repeat (4 copies)
VIVGSAGDDFIDGGDGEDHIAGDSIAFGVNGTATGDGDDRILGGDGVEFVAGDNVTYGDAIGGSDDYIDGGAGVEFLWGDNLAVVEERHLAPQGM